MTPSIRKMAAFEASANFDSGSPMQTLHACDDTAISVNARPIGTGDM
jgi:hypothetical protein